MKKIIVLLALLICGTANADLVPTNQSCSFGAPISSVYQQANGTWVIQVYGGINAIGGYDLVVNHSQLVFKGLKNTKSLSGFSLGWLVEDNGFAGFGNSQGQCDYTREYLQSLGLSQNNVYIIKK